MICRLRQLQVKNMPFWRQVYAKGSMTQGGTITPEFLWCIFQPTFKSLIYMWKKWCASRVTMTCPGLHSELINCNTGLELWSLVTKESLLFSYTMLLPYHNGGGVQSCQRKASWIGSKHFGAEERALEILLFFLHTWQMRRARSGCLTDLSTARQVCLPQSGNKPSILMLISFLFTLPCKTGFQIAFFLCKPKASTQMPTVYN